MKINTTLAGMIGATALMAVTAAAQAAPGLFDYTTVFSPNPITTTSGGIGTILVTNGSDNNDNAAFSAMGTQINLTNFKERSGATTPGFFSDPVSIALTIKPVDSPSTKITNTFTGTFSGSFDSNGTATGLIFTQTGAGSAPQSYNFGQFGTYTVQAPLSFTPPGAPGSSTLGAISANVTYTPAVSTVPEPATIVPFVFGGLALLVLAARKTRKSSSVTA